MSPFKCDGGAAVGCVANKKVELFICAVSFLSFAWCVIKCKICMCAIDIRYEVRDIFVIFVFVVQIAP